jgi:hypothetical protein
MKELRSPSDPHLSAALRIAVNHIRSPLSLFIWAIVVRR